MTEFSSLTRVLETCEGLEFAVLIGSRSSRSATRESDWDIALGWSPALPWLERVSRTEILRGRIAGALKEQEARIDLIDLADANLAMRAVAAEDGVCLCGEDSTAWAKFLRRIWRELEDYYWEKQHAA